MEIIDIVKKLPKKNPHTRSLKLISMIVVHHSATFEGTPQAFARYHVHEKHWRCIGYHCVIAKDGTIYKTNNDSTLAPHTVGKNSISIGICLVGNFDKEKPTAEQLDALDFVIDHYCQSYPNIERIAPHRAFANKTCPGRLFPERFFRRTK